MIARSLDGHEPGPVSLTPHRFVWWTGKVAVGIRFEARYVEQGTHAQMIQRLLTTPLPKDWYETPQMFYVVEPWWLKAWRFIWRAR